MRTVGLHLASDSQVNEWSTTRFHWRACLTTFDMHPHDQRPSSVSHHLLLRLFSMDLPPMPLADLFVSFLPLLDDEVM